MNAGYVPRKKRQWGIGARTIPDRCGRTRFWSILAVMVSSGGQLVAVNAKTGAEEHKVELGAPALIGPIVAGNMIYVVTDNAQLIALR